MSESSSEFGQSGRRAFMRIHWHQFLGKDFDLVFTPLGLEILLERLALSEPPRIDIVILRRHTPEWTAEQFALLPDGIRQSKASHILIEHKQTESINLQVFKQALIYDELYPQGHGVKPSEVQTFILSARTPSPKTLQECGFVAGELAGVYTSNNLYAARLTLISLNELQPTLNNAFVQCFATRRRVRDAAANQVRAEGDRHLALVPAKGDQADADHGTHGRRQQHDRRQQLPAQQCAQTGQQLEIAFAHAFDAAQLLVAEGQQPQRAVTRESAPGRRFEPGAGPAHAGTEQAQADQGQRQVVGQVGGVQVDQRHRHHQRHRRAPQQGGRLSAELPAAGRKQQRRQQFDQRIALGDRLAAR